MEASNNKFFTVEAWIARFVDVHSEEVPALINAFFAFFFLLAAYFVVLPLRDEAALSLGTTVLPTLFVASMLLTMLAAPASSYLFSLPHLSKGRALHLLYRFFGASLVVFFILYSLIPINQCQARKAVVPQRMMDGLGADGPSVDIVEDSEAVLLSTWRDLSWVCISLRAVFFVWIALLNLLTVSLMWTRLADVFSSEAGTRLFGFLGAGATLGQLAGSLVAFGMARLGPYLLLLSALMLELAARSAMLVGEDDDSSNQLFPMSASEVDEEGLKMEEASPILPIEGSENQSLKTKVAAVLEGLRLILASSYLLHVCSFLWLSAIIQAFFYFQRATVVAEVVRDPMGRRALLAEIYTLMAVFILLAQLTVSGRLLTNVGITAGLCIGPLLAIVNLTAIAFRPSSLVIALTEALSKVVLFVITRPAQEILFTVITKEEKYKAKVFVDTFVHSLGDAAAAGVYKVMQGVVVRGPSGMAISALPMAIAWLAVGFALGRRQVVLTYFQEDPLETSMKHETKIMNVTEADNLKLIEVDNSKITEADNLKHIEANNSKITEADSLKVSEGAGEQNLVENV